MQLNMWPYASLETMQALVFGGRLLLLHFLSYFDRMIHDIHITFFLLVWMTLHYFISLTESPVTHWKLAIFFFLNNIFTHVTHYATKKIRNRIVIYVDMSSILCMCPTVNSPMAKIIAWETITLKRTIILEYWRSSRWRHYFLHAFLRMILLWLPLLLRGIYLFYSTTRYHMSRILIVKTSNIFQWCEWPWRIILLWHVIFLLSWLLVFPMVHLVYDSTATFIFSCRCFCTRSAPF